MSNSIKALLVFLLISANAQAGVVNGQPINAAVTNAAFLDKNTDTSTVYNIALNSAEAGLGSTVTSIQTFLNAVSSYVGVALTSAYNALPTWMTSNRGTYSDSLFARVSAIDTAFDPSTGHSHTGTTGNGPKINLATATTGVLPPSSLPSPTATSLGGVESYTSVTHQWLNSLGVNGVFTSSQPSFADISGTIANSQLPYPLPSPSPSGLPLCSNGTAYVLGGCATGGGGNLTPIAPYSVLGNNSGATASPSPVPILAISQQTTQGFIDNNLLTNGGFEVGTSATGWTQAGTGTYSTVTSPVYGGAQVEKIALSSQTFTLSQDVSPALNYPGVNMEASCKIYTGIATGVVQFCLREGGTALTGSYCQSVTTGSVWTPATINFAPPASGSIGLQVAATFPSNGTVYVDDCYLGPARNLSQVSQAQYLGSVYTPYTASCNWTNTSGSFSSFSATSACPVATASGSITAPATKIPGLIIPSIGPGTIYLVASGEMLTTASAGGQAGSAWRFYDGTNGTEDIFPYNNTGGGTSQTVSTGHLIGSLTYSTPQSNLSIQIQSKLIAGTSNIIHVDDQTTGFKIDVYYFPSTSQLAVNSNAQPGLTNWTTYPMVITGSVSNPTVGTTTTNLATWRQVGDSMELNYNLVQTGAGSAGSGNYLFSLPSGYSIDSTKVLTSNNNSTALGTCTAYNGSTTIVGVVQVADSTHLYCMTGYSSTPTLIGSAYYQLSGSTVNYGFTARIPISGWTAPTQMAPILVGSVTSTTSGAEHIERATVSTRCTSTPCTIASQSGAWLTSISRSGAGSYTVNIASGEFSNTPSCTCSAANTTGTNTVCAIGVWNTNNATTQDLTIVNLSGSGTDSSFSIICMGPH